MALDLGMTFDFDSSVVNEGVVAVGEFDGALLLMALPITPIGRYFPWSR